MHKLQRPTAPPCLARYSYKKHKWQDVSDTDKTAIRQSLYTMQQHRCAYCEKSLLEDKPCHIEHFRQRSCHPQGTFTWDNLYLSCNTTNTCGKYKDQQSYHWQDLIDPCTDDPDDYLRFYSDGNIRPRKNLSPSEQKRAKETIRVFNLNEQALQATRKSELQGWLQIAEELLRWQEISEDDYQTELTQYLQRISGKPFETAIRHLLLP